MAPVNRLNATEDAQRERQRLQAIKDDPSLSETDWMGLLLGLGAALTAIMVCVGATYLLVRYF